MEVVMNHAQYLDWKYGNKTTLDIKLENLGIRDSKKFEKQLAIGIGTTLFLVNNPTNAFAVDLGAIDTLGNTFLSIVRRVGYWIALISALTEIIKTSMRGGNNSAEIGKIIMKYLLIYASLYLMPWLFDLVKGAF
jgi:hypothetical protein